MSAEQLVYRIEARDLAYRYAGQMRFMARMRDKARNHRSWMPTPAQAIAIHNCFDRTTQ